jgi:hypothetical protein
MVYLLKQDTFYFENEIDLPICDIIFGDTGK